MISTLTSYRIVTKDTQRSLQVIAKDRAIERESAYYLSKIGDIKSVDEFIGDRRVYAYALRAFGMADMIPSRALVKKVLEGGIDSRTSLANSLADPRFKELVENFNFARYGATTTTFTRTQQGTVDRLLRQTLEENAGQTNEGVRLALYFQRKAPSITSVYQILADKALYKVVETAFSLPAMLPSAGIDKQAQVLAKKLDITTLKQPAKVEALLERFANMWDLSGNTTSLVSPTLTLFGTSASPSISSETLASIQKLRSRGS